MFRTARLKGESYARLNFRPDHKECNLGLGRQQSLSGPAGRLGVGGWGGGSPQVKPGCSCCHYSYSDRRSTWGDVTLQQDVRNINGTTQVGGVNPVNPDSPSSAKHRKWRKARTVGTREAVVHNHTICTFTHSSDCKVQS